MTFARWVFRIAGVYGLIVLLPMYFTLQQFGDSSPPAVNHAEFYFGFVGMAAVFQFVFLLISADPKRYRPLMWVGVLEKLSFGIPVVLMWNHLGRDLHVGGTLDLLWSVLFAIAFLRTSRHRRSDLHIA